MLKAERLAHEVERHVKIANHVKQSLVLMNKYHAEGNETEERLARLEYDTMVDLLNETEEMFFMFHTSMSMFDAKDPKNRVVDMYYRWYCYEEQRWCQETLVMLPEELYRR